MFAKSLSTLALLVVAQVASVANAETFEVPNWIVPYNGATEWQASVGDTIVFTWTGGHNVFIHPSGSCDLTDRIFVGSQPQSSYTFTEADGSADGNELFFACDIGGGAHCRFGQALTVMVYSGAAPGGAGVVPDEPVIAPTEAPVPVTQPPVPMTQPPVVDEPVDEPDMGPADNESGASFNTFSVASVVGLVGAVVAVAL